ncbi:MAG: BlaI/MecI/CopY family transcriptional regulator [Candidatus Latescibacterota bacterium]
MARWKSRTLTEGELDFMRVLWELREASPDEIQTALAASGRFLTGGTIRNVLAVMMEKEYVSRRKQGKAHLYRAFVDEEQALKSMAQDLLATAFGGSESLLVASLLKNRDVHPDELEKIERLIDEQKRGDGK